MIPISRIPESKAAHILKHDVLAGLVARAEPDVEFQLLVPAVYEPWRDRTG